jgi:branched-chain amino acid transport system ATP-binding protein
VTGSFPSGADPAGDGAPLLELQEITVRFGGHIAVDSVDLSVAAGTITGLIGPNGAGKTTTFNVITGLQAPSAGRLRLTGNEITRMRAHRRAQAGIGRTFQRLEVFGSLTARENILVGVELRRRWGRRAEPSPTALALLAEAGLIQPQSGPDVLNGILASEETDALVDLVGVRAVADTRADELPTGLARLVELGRALATRPRLLLLDEPASGQDEGETEAFAQLLTRLVGTGMGILLVEHDVPLVMRLCSKVCVLDFGSVLATGTPAEVQANKAVINAYLGAEPVTADAMEHLHEAGAG